MNYQKHYDLLISTRLKLQEERIIQKKIYNLYDNHHIIPKCLGGSNDKYNLMLLTYKEHYIAHWLLTKIYSNESKLPYALWRMSNLNNKYIGHSSNKYKLTRILFIKSISNGSRAGKNNPMYGKRGTKSPLYGKIKSEYTKNKISASHMGKTLSKEHIEKIRISKQGKNNLNYGLLPWQTNIIKKRPNLLYNWSQLDKIYNIWISNDKPGYTKLYNLSKIDTNLKESSKSFGNMIKWFLENGDPRNHNEWIIFKNLINHQV